MSLWILSSHIHHLKPSPPCSDENGAPGEPSSLRWPRDNEWLSGLLRWMKIPQLLPKQADFNQMALGRIDLAIVLDIIKSWMKTAPLLRTYIIIALHRTRHREVWTVRKSGIQSWVHKLRLWSSTTLRTWLRDTHGGYWAHQGDTMTWTVDKSNKSLECRGC